MEWMEEDELLRSRLRGGARGSGYGHLCEENKNCRTLTTLFCNKKTYFQYAQISFWYQNMGQN